MSTWREYRKTISSISQSELALINVLSQLEAIRVSGGISQKEFAEMIGTKQPQLAKLERLDSVPTLATLERYAEGLGLKISLSITSVWK